MARWLPRLLALLTLWLALLLWARLVILARLLPFRPALLLWLSLRTFGLSAFRRAVEKGDGFHFVGLEPSAVAPVVERLRRDRPEETFTISARTGWDPQGMDPDVIRRERDEFEAAGVQHMVAAPWQKDLDSWLRSMDQIAALVDLG